MNQPELTIDFLSTSAASHFSLQLSFLWASRACPCQQETHPGSQTNRYHGKCFAVRTTTPLAPPAAGFQGPSWYCPSETTCTGPLPSWAQTPACTCIRHTLQRMPCRAGHAAFDINPYSQVSSQQLQVNTNTTLSISALASTWKAGAFPKLLHETPHTTLSNDRGVAALHMVRCWARGSLRPPGKLNRTLWVPRGHSRAKLG